VIHISSDGDTELLDSTTMGRAVGVIWLLGDININEEMVESGHCYHTKAQLMAALSDNEAF
jgi:endonuclease YncB( thermonuclease family)